MNEDVPFAVRRGELLDRAVDVFSADVRFPAGWLEGSLADGSADSLMLLEKDRRAFHRNMFTRAKLLAPEQRDECARLVDRIETAVRKGDRVAMRDAHLEIHRKLCLLAGAAFEKYGLKFPPRVESEMVEFYKREWPM